MKNSEAQLVKNLPATQQTREMRVQSPGWEDPLEGEMATHSSWWTRGACARACAHTHTCAHTQSEAQKYFGERNHTYTQSEAQITHTHTQNEAQITHTHTHTHTHTEWGTILLWGKKPLLSGFEVKKMKAAGSHLFSELLYYHGFKDNFLGHYS